LRLLDRILAVPLVLFSLLVIGVVAALATEVSGRELFAALTSAETFFALRLSVLVSLTAIICAVAIGVPAAYFLARKQFPGKGVIDTCLDVPLVMPPLIAGVGLLFLFGKSNLGGPLAAIGLNFIFSPWGAVMAQTFIATPIVIRSSKAAFESIDSGYEETAMTLGLNPLKVFLKVNLPLAGRSILSGIVLAWARAVGEFGATLMVAGATRLHTETLPIAVYLNISSGEMGVAVACALVLVFAAFMLLLLMKRIQGNNINLPLNKRM
jgi:molybdate transport system permease protein